ncbi:MAG: hypothetical protein HON90_09410 [Halobacteriovoraceae bacterium]|nr:hypothetical protein [Halobacteriovoraceae bacterium]
MSFFTHIGFIQLSFKPSSNFKTPPLSLHKFKLNKLRTVGTKKGVNKKTFFAKKQKYNLKNLALPTPTVTPPGPQQRKKNKKNKNTFKSLNINRKNISQILKTTPPGYLTPKQALSALSQTDVDIKLEVPKGIPVDQLNKHELVFYSFQKRAFYAYANSIQKELNNFERKNPHLRFPFTQDKQKLAGRVYYDKNGDILKIETLQWTNVEKLQALFMQVLQNMSSLPNPPKEILEDESFAINFILTINT